MAKQKNYNSKKDTTERFINKIKEDNKLNEYLNNKIFKKKYLYQIN